MGSFRTKGLFHAAGHQPPCGQPLTRRWEPSGLRSRFGLEGGLRVWQLGCTLSQDPRAAPAGSLELPCPAGALRSSAPGVQARGGGVLIPLVKGISAAVLAAELLPGRCAARCRLLQCRCPCRGIWVQPRDGCCTAAAPASVLHTEKAPSRLRETRQALGLWAGANGSSAAGG